MKFKIGEGKSALTLAAVVACCALMVGCGVKHPAKVPFGSTECKSMTQTDALAELQEAGFTEITTAEVETVSRAKDGKVESIIINGEDYYKKDKTWENNVPVDVTSYKLKEFPVEMNVETSGESDSPIFTVHTNLPEGATLRLTLTGDDFQKK